MMRKLTSLCSLLCCLAVSSFSVTVTTNLRSSTYPFMKIKHHTQRASDLDQYRINKLRATKQDNSVEETVEKYGLEAGLFESLKQKEGGAESAKDLLKKYGVAYLATSIPLAIVSFAICYFLVESGVDVAALLAKVGIQVNDNSERVGTAAIAYAAHKAASPIRFPPTVLLTPVVAKLIGKEPNGEDDNTANI